MHENKKLHQQLVFFQLLSSSLFVFLKIAIWFHYVQYM